MDEQNSPKTKGTTDPAAVPPAETPVAGETEPTLRHEFVGMMFAVTAAEVGLQVAAVVQKGNWIHYLPAYSHLFLATIIVGASWVGWSLSPAPGARQDVRHVLHTGFLVLLLDVGLVIIYFILVRSVDFAADQIPPYIASIPRVASWIVFMFVVYLGWDVLTKFPLLYKKKFDKRWFVQDGTRILATVLCLLLAWLTRVLLGNPDQVHYIPADFTLLCLILLFRALKDVCSAFFPTKTVEEKELKLRKKRAIRWTVGCVVFMLLGFAWTNSLNPLPAGVEQDIQREIPTEKKNPEPLLTPPQTKPQK